MFITCDTGPKMKCICLSRDLPEEKIAAGCLLYGYGSIPPGDVVMENGTSRALEAVAGTVTQALEQGINDPNNRTNLQHIANLTAGALRSASHVLWELCRYTGQGIYVNGTIVYFCGVQYAAVAFGGAALLTFEGGRLQHLGTPPSVLISDAIGCRDSWSGKFWKGTLSPTGILLGTTGLPYDWNKLQQELAEQLTPDSHAGTAAMTVRKMLMLSSDTAAAIEFRNE